MLKGLTQKEYWLLRNISFKYNKYYVNKIRLHTKTKILEALRLNLKIKVYDGIEEKWRELC